MSEPPIIANRATSLAAFVGVLIFMSVASVLASPSLKNKSAASVEPQKVTVMTYNIQQLGYPNWAGNHFEKQRLTLIPGAIKALSKRPDVLILQEVFTEHSFKFLVNTISDTYPYHTQVAAENCGDSRWTSVSENCDASLIRGNSGVLIFSRWPIEEQHAYVFDAVRVSKSFDFLARKGVVYAKIQVDGEVDIDERAIDRAIDRPMTLHVFGTHLQASVEEHDIRLLQLDEMRRFVDGFQIPVEQPVILGGDFNVSSIDQPRFNDLLERAMATVTLPDAGVGSISDSTNGYRRLLDGDDSDVRPELTLDYLLLRTDHLQPLNNPKLQVIEFKSKSPWLGTRLFKPDVELFDLSDHYPSIIELEF